MFASTTAFRRVLRPEITAVMLCLVGGLLVSGHFASAVQGQENGAGSTSHLDAAAQSTPFPLEVRITSSSWVARNGEVQTQILLSNLTDQSQRVDVSLSLQANPALKRPLLPDPVRGLDHASQASSRTVFDGEIVARNTLVDGQSWTSGETPQGAGTNGTEADQYIQLDQPRRITAMGWHSGDANWVHQVDVFASQDGQEFRPVPELQNFVMHQKWGEQMFPPFQPFTAKVLRLHYHSDGKQTPRIRMPADLQIYDGPANDEFGLPRVGEEIASASQSVEVPAQSERLASANLTETLPTGGYLLAVKATVEGRSQLATASLFAEPKEVEQVDPSSRFGLNASSGDLFDENRKLGIGWVRFENLKWAMASDSRQHYDYTGKIAPWHVNMDEFLRQYDQRGISVLGISITTPEWAQDSSEVPEKMKAARPPREPAMYGEFAFQTMARYGSKEHPADVLWTEDKRSGLGLLNVFEPWNEPNLNPRRGDQVPSWGAWSGTMAQFWPVFRAGAEGAKRGDPNARVTSPAFAGMTTDIVDVLRHHEYADGKRPIDFVDVINVHFYSGRTPPEIASRDDNNATDLDATYPELVRRLAEWRDATAPEAQIWLTETGYDDGGPIGTNERLQAARLPRVVALALAHGIDKVMVYREQGNTPAQHAAAGLVRNDSTRKPSWYTYAQLIRQLDGASDALRLPTLDNNVRVYRWVRDGEPMIMAWAVTGDGEPTLEHDFGAATLTDAFGRQQEVSATKAHRLSEFPIYLSNLSKHETLEPLVRQARRREAERTEARQALASRDIRLFNFGNPAEPVATDLGKIRYFQPVPAAMTYDAAAGYGWEGQMPEAEFYQHWIESKPLAHSVRLKPNTTFRMDLEPGTYEVTLHGSGRRGQASGMVTLDGGGESVSLAFENDTSATARVEVSDGSLRVTNPDEVHLRWLSAERVD